MISPRGSSYFVAAALLLLLSSCSNGGTPGQQEPPKAPVESVERAGDWLTGACGLPDRYLERIERGLWPSRSPDVMFIPARGNFFGGFAHSGPDDHLQEVPLVFYGPGFIRPLGTIHGRDSTVADLPATFAELLDVSLSPRASGVPVAEALTGRGRPALIITVVWDAGGWNVLRRWPGAAPFLGKLMKDGTSVRGTTVGSSPSVTPPIHATIGTGAFPNVHGIVDIPQRAGEEILDSWQDTSPEQLEVPTLADIYDASVDNRAQVGLIAERRWHLGMMGSGSYIAGADKDIAVVQDPATEGVLLTNEDYYELPGYLQDEEVFSSATVTVDAEDGSLDSRWLGHDILGDPYHLRWTPVWGEYQTELLEELIQKEGFGSDDVTDLLYVNYKQIDHVGHRWAISGPEMKSAVQHADEELREIVTFLDQEVGKGRWVLGLTADHGAQPRTEGVVIDQSTLTDVVEERFSATGELVLEDRPLGMWLDRDYMEANDITPAQVASYISRVTAADLGSGDASQRLFSAALPTAAWERIERCAG